MLLMHFDNQAQYGESATKAYDFSGHGNNGTISGATWSSSGKFSGAYTFDGTNDLINISIPSSGSLDIDSNPVTMVAWIKPSSVSIQQAIVARGTSDGVSAGGYGYGFWINSNGKINVGSFGGGNFDGNTVVLTANTWYHVAVVINGASSALYLNGVDDTPASHTVSVVASSQPLKIGASRNLTDTADMRFFSGTIDELAIWNRSLSSQEVQQLYSSSSPISCGNCLHKSDTNCDGCVDMTELSPFISRWNINNLDVTMKELIEAIGLWNKGCSG